MHTLRRALARLIDEPERPGDGLALLFWTLVAGLAIGVYVAVLLHAGGAL